MKTKKELKKEYKQMEPPMGVFQIRNLINNKVFIDSGVDMKAKWNRHKAELRFRNHRNKLLQEEWNEYGENNFIFEVLSELEKKDEPHINYQKELKLLQEMVIAEMDIQNLY